MQRAEKRVELTEVVERLVQIYNPSHEGGLALLLHMASSGVLPQQRWRAGIRPFNRRPFDAKIVNEGLVRHSLHSCSSLDRRAPHDRTGDAQVDCGFHLPDHPIDSIDHAGKSRIGQATLVPSWLDIN